MLLNNFLWQPYLIDIIHVSAALFAANWKLVPSTCIIINRINLKHSNSVPQFLIAVISFIVFYLFYTCYLRLDQSFDSKGTAYNLFNMMNDEFGATSFKGLLEFTSFWCVPIRMELKYLLAPFSFASSLFCPEPKYCTESIWNIYVDVMHMLHIQ